jgi:hypothetical protein
MRQRSRRAVSRSGLVLLGLVLGAGAAQAAAAPSLVGTWVYQEGGYRVSVSFTADKHFTRSESAGGQSATARGTYWAQDGALALRPEGATAKISFTYRFANSNTLILQQAGGGAIQMERKAAAAKPAGTGSTAGLNAPVSQAIKNLIASLSKTRDASGAGRITIRGWPTIMGPWGSFQYPKGWRVVARTDYGGWVADPRGRTQIMLSVLDVYQGAPSFEQFRDALNRKLIKTTNIRVLASWDRRGAIRGASFEDGLSRVWAYRWIHPSGTGMFGVLRVTILARGPLQTSISWGADQCPEAEAPATWKEVFRPSDRTAWFPIPKGDGGPADKDGDGFPDTVDADPDDPQVH